MDAADKSAVVLRLTPQSGVGQELEQSHLSIEPQVNLYEFHDAFGNLLQRIMLGQGRAIITSTCTVDTPDEIASDTSADFTLIQNLPDDVLHYLLQSRYCESDKMLKLATSIVKRSASGYSQVERSEAGSFARSDTSTA